MGPSHSHNIANLLDCTSCTGAGPGLIDAVIQGVMLAGKPVGGFKIEKAGNGQHLTFIHTYRPKITYHTCRFFTARKHGLVDFVVRNNPFDKTAAVALPGGIGTLYEVFEILALIQLEQIGSELLCPLPFDELRFILFKAAGIF